MPNRKTPAQRARRGSAAVQQTVTPKNQPRADKERAADYRARKAKQHKVQIAGHISRRAKEYLDELAREQQTGLFVVLNDMILRSANRKKQAQKRKEAAQSHTPTLWDEEPD